MKQMEIIKFNSFGSYYIDQSKGKSVPVVIITQIVQLGLLTH